MFCSPSEGGVTLVVCRADRAPRYTSLKEPFQDSFSTMDSGAGKG